MKILTPRLIKNLGASSFGQLVNLIIQVFSIPIFLHYWGVKLYGEWLILSTIPTYLSLSDFGFASVSANTMTMQVASSNKKDALETFQSAWALLTITSLICIILSLAATLIPINSMLGINEISSKDTKIIIVVLCIIVAINLKISILAAGFRCDGNYATSTLILNFIRLFEFSSLALSLQFNIGPVELVFIYLTIRLLGFAIYYKILRRKSDWLEIGYTHAKLSIIKKLSKPSFTFMALPIGNAIKTQGLLTIVGVSMGPVMAVTFSTMRTIANSALQIISIISASIWPEISKSFGSGDYESAKMLHRISCKASLWISLISVIIIYIFSEDILSIWTNGKVIPDPIFLKIILLTIFLNSFWQASSIVLMSINKHGKMAILYLLSTILSLLISFTLIEDYGLPGVGVSLLLIEIIMVSFVIRYSMKVLNDNIRSLFIYILKPSI